MVQGRFSQCARVGEPFDEAEEIRYDGFHLGLLKHDFGHPDAVGVRILLPRQVMPAMAFEPGQQGSGEFRHQSSAGLEFRGQSKNSFGISYSDPVYFTLSPYIRVVQGFPS